MIENIVGKIEKGVEIFASIRPHISPFPFENMNIGDSSLVSGDEKFICNFYGRVTYAQKKYNIKLTTRKLNKNSVRVWRVE